MYGKKPSGHTTTGDTAGDTTGTQDTNGHGTHPEKRGTQDNRHIYVFSQALEKSIKKVKKNLKIRKRGCNFVAVIKNQSNMNTLTFRIYKNEIDAARLAFIRKSFSIYEESEKVLTVEGSKDDILKLYDNYLLDEAQFKAAYPDYMTYAERVAYTGKMCECIKDYFRKALCEIIDNGEITPEYERLRNIYLDELK